MHTNELIKYTGVSFTCPVCGKRLSHQLVYVEDSNASSSRKVSLSTTCRCKSCENTVVLSYRIRTTSKGHLKLNVLSCRVFDKWYSNKRYQLTPH